MELNEDQIEGIKVVLDAFAHGMEAGSGMLDWRELCAIRKVAHALGLNPDDFTPDKFLAETNYFNKYENGKPLYWCRRYASWPDPATPLTDAPVISEEV